MVKTSTALFIGACVITIGAWTASAGKGAQSAAPGAEVQEGRRLYQAKCAVCHVPATRSAEPYGPPLSKMQVATPENAVKTIQNGGARMPGFQYTLSPSQISAIVSFLKTLDAPPDRIVVSAPISP